MSKTNHLFTQPELEQTQTLLSVSDFGSRPLVKGFTIDDEQSLDLDDAIWVETHGEVGKIQIHIADPTAVIKIDSPLDQGVRKRFSTLYLPSGKVPLLPPSICEQKLSLLEGEPKFTLTIDISLNCKGEILDYQIFESCFLSLGKLSYKEAEVITNNPEHQLYVPLNSARLWANILNRRRVKQGAFAGIIKGDFYLNEDGQIQIISCRSQVLIAEYMILANTLVAQWLVDQSQTALYRNHLPSRDLDSDLDQIKSESADMENFSAHYSHCLAKAHYSPVCEGHLALATGNYLHFTSPLRRCADFVVHRIVKAALAGQPSPYSTEEILTCAELINQFHLEQKVNKTNYLKQKRDRNLGKINDYSNLEAKDFSRLIELSLRSDSFGKIRPEIEIRLEAGQLSNTDLSLILFETEELPLQQQIFHRLEDHQFVNLLHNCPQILDRISHLKYEELIYQPEQLLFISRLIVNLNNQDLTSPQPVGGKNKKDAKIQAYKFWLQAYLDQQLIPAPQSPEIPTELLKSQPKVKEIENPSALSTLHNLCQQQKWQKPSFEYTQEDALFVCTATLDLPTISLSTVGQALKKRTAQNLAAELLLSKINEELIFENEDQPINETELIENHEEDNLDQTELIENNEQVNLEQTEGLSEKFQFIFQGEIISENDSEFFQLDSGAKFKIKQITPDSYSTSMSPWEVLPNTDNDGQIVSFILEKCLSPELDPQPPNRLFIQAGRILEISKKRERIKVKIKRVGHKDLRIGIRQPTKNMRVGQLWSMKLILKDNYLYIQQAKYLQD